MLEFQHLLVPIGALRFISSTVLYLPDFGFADASMRDSSIIVVQFAHNVVPQFLAAGWFALFLHKSALIAREALYSGLIRRLLYLGFVLTAD